MVENKVHVSKIHWKKGVLFVYVKIILFLFYLIFLEKNIIMTKKYVKKNKNSAQNLFRNHKYNNDNVCYKSPFKFLTIICNNRFFDISSSLQKFKKGLRVSYENIEFGLTNS